MKNLFIVILAVCVIGSAALSRTAFAQEAELFDEDAPRLTDEQRSQINRLNQEFQAITDPIARRDRRYPQYAADLEELPKIDDPRLFAEKYAAFRVNYDDFQREVLRLAGITERDYNLRLQQILPHLRLDEEGRIVNEGSEPARARLDQRRPAVFRNETFNFLNASEETFEKTDFSEKWSVKDCFWADVEFPSSKSFRVDAETDMLTADCQNVKAARGTIINVPSGVKKVRVEIFMDQYHLKSWVFAYGIFAYGNAYSAVGIRVRGLILGSPNLVNYFRHKYRDISWSVYGDDTVDFTETDARMVCSFTPLMPGEYTIQAYGRVAVDTDGFAISEAASSVGGLEKIRITFFR